MSQVFTVLSFQARCLMRRSKQYLTERIVTADQRRFVVEFNNRTLGTVVGPPYFRAALPVYLIEVCSLMSGLKLRTFRYGGWLKDGLKVFASFDDNY